MQGRKHSAETIRKFKELKRPTGKDHHSFGKKFSKEQIEAMVKPRIGLKRSDEFKEKQRQSALKLNLAKHLKHDNNRHVIDSNGNKFDSLVNTAKFWNMSVQSVCDILKGRTKQSRKGIIFKYYEL